LIDTAYRAALEAIGRPERELVPVNPEGESSAGGSSVSLVLVGGRVMDFGDWPAFAFALPKGRHVLGHTHPKSLYPKSTRWPKLFEGSQCEVRVGDEVSITRDLSTNGTLVIPPDIARNRPRLWIDDELRSLFDQPCPIVVRPHDVLLTQYAELVLLSYP
jgi:hypothetical protein